MMGGIVKNMYFQSITPHIASCHYQLFGGATWVRKIGCFKPISEIRQV